MLQDPGLRVSLTSSALSRGGRRFTRRTFAALLVALLFGVAASPPPVGATAPRPVLEFLVKAEVSLFAGADAIVTDRSGNVFITGHFSRTVVLEGVDRTVTSATRGGRDAYLAGFDADGRLLFFTTMGGEAHDYGRGLALDAAGNVIVVGNFGKSAEFGSIGASASLTSTGGQDIFLATYTPTGQLISAHSLGGPRVDQATAVGVDSNDNLALTGTFTGTVDFDLGPDTTTLTSNGETDAFLATYTPDGKLRAAVNLGTSDDDSVTPVALAINSNNNIALTGTFTGSVDFDSGPDTTTLTSDGDTDAFLASFTPTSNLRWAARIGGPGADQAAGVAIDSNDNISLAGTFASTVDFDPGPLTAALTSNGETDAFLATYNAQSEFRSATSVGGPTIDEATAIAIDTSDNVTITGTFTSTADFDPGPDTTALTSSGDADTFLASYDASRNLSSIAHIAGGGTSQAITTDNDGRLLLAGTYTGLTEFGTERGADEPTTTNRRGLFLAQYLVTADRDGDGFEGPFGNNRDCDDANPAINPDATDVPYNDVDEDCDGSDLTDQDGDGSPSTAPTGGVPDCDDTNPAVNPDATEIPSNDLDDNCDGYALEDQDRDGFPANPRGDEIADCDDTDPNVNPDATEIPDNDLDDDCNGYDGPLPTCLGHQITIDMNLNGGDGQGTPGPDVILGTPGADEISSGDGDDYICSGGGDDVIESGDGEDRIEAGAGNDRIESGDGDDYVVAGQGNDIVDGGRGDDRLFGSPGDDVMKGDAGNDTLHGNQGLDILNGEWGDDRLFGYAGDDLLHGGRGNDKIFGHFGDDLIIGGPGADRLFGWGDDDTIRGGDGNDLIAGNFGNDTLEGGNNSDIIYGGDGNDRLEGGDGNDELHGNSLDDTLAGGAGKDMLDGGIGVDACDGGADNDTSLRCETRRNFP